MAASSCSSSVTLHRSRVNEGPLRLHGTTNDRQPAGSASARQTNLWCRPRDAVAGRAPATAVAGRGPAVAGRWAGPGSSTVTVGISGMTAGSVPFSLPSSTRSLASIQTVGDEGSTAAHRMHSQQLDLLTLAMLKTCRHGTPLPSESQRLSATSKAAGGVQEAKEGWHRPQGDSLPGTSLRVACRPGLACVMQCTSQGRGLAQRLRWGCCTAKDVRERLCIQGHTGSAGAVDAAGKG